MVVAVARGIDMCWIPGALAGISPASTAEKESSCFLKPEIELDARFWETMSCQRLLAVMADAA